MLGVLFSLLEIVLRKSAPELSLAFLIAHRVEGIESELVLSNIDYRPGCDLAVALGYTGVAIMLSGIAYVARRRLSFMRNVGSLRAWFDWHVMSGVIGPSFILLHSAAKLDNWVSLGLWSLVITVLSGLLGRYLTTELPERASRAAIDTLDVDRVLGNLRTLHQGVAAADAWFDVYRREVKAFNESLGGENDFRAAFSSFVWVLRDDILRRRDAGRLYRMLRSSIAGGDARQLRRKAARAALELALFERRRVLLPRIEPLYSRWKMIHVPFAVAMSLIGGLHIFIELRR
jgi:hypothetical protein